MADWLIVGLGNPGMQYTYTWHNLGFLLLDALAKQFKVSVTKLKFQAQYGECKVAGDKIYFLKPLTYMNESGLAVAAAARYFKIAPENIFVIYDDFDIEFLELRYRAKGGAGTHNGMRSLLKHLQTDNFKRLRVGAGPLPAQIDIVNFVLGQIPNAKLRDLDALALRAYDFVNLMLAGRVDVAENRLHSANPKALAKIKAREAASAQKRASRNKAAETNDSKAADLQSPTKAADAMAAKVKGQD